MHAALIEAVPAAGRRVLRAKALEIQLAVIADHVVLAGNEMGVELGGADNLLGGVEFGGLRQVGDVASVDQHRRLVGQRGDLVERRLQGRVRVGIGLGLEPHMGVADLDEAERVRRGRQRRSAKAKAARNPAGDAPDDAGAGPAKAFQDVAPGAAGFLDVMGVHNLSLRCGMSAMETGARCGLFVTWKNFSRRE
jgi:hypothetical protein